MKLELTSHRNILAAASHVESIDFRVQFVIEGGLEDSLPVWIRAAFKLLENLNFILQNAADRKAKNKDEKLHNLINCMDLLKTLR